MLKMNTLQINIDLKILKFINHMKDCGIFTDSKFCLGNVSVISKVSHMKFTSFGNFSVLFTSYLFEFLSYELAKISVYL